MIDFIKNILGAAKNLLFDVLGLNAVFSQISAFFTFIIVVIIICVIIYAIKKPKK